MQYLAIITLCALMFGCASPLAIDTPRLETRLTNYLSARTMHVTVTPGDTFAIPEWQYAVDRAYVAVDTTGGRPALWLDYTLSAPPGTSVFNRLLERVHIRLDSALVNGGSMYMMGNPETGTGTTVKTIYNADDSVHSSVVVLDAANTTTDVRGSILIQAPWSGNARATILITFELTR